ncbi:cytochrome-c peroxidase [Aurantibacillus circumpalustris]|uniref:cytochrome-c peroxidase n=1 Tax=Aurantibacillus circumpalustris TaxID=3036359 RepID=UPI00295BC5D8|nr:cytochrome c peroxidase [Aurantibacillus circumpalustris]
MKVILKTITVFTLFSSCVETVKKEKITTETELGERLFFDPILSRDSSISCASCHKPEFAFADNTALSEGVFHRLGTRNTPSAMNQSNRNFYFWDGRSETLSEQALGPMENHVEMDFPLTLSIRRLLKNKEYLEAFQHVYGKVPSKALLGQAIAAYEETLETGNTVFDKYMSGDDTTLMSESAKRGLKLFNKKGKCFDCHFGVDFTGNDRFKNIGLYNGKNLNDEGRYTISGNKKDLGAFKVPGLRNIAQTGPYMHNGQFKTLREVIDYYDTPDKFIPNSINRDSLLNKPLNLSEEEKKDLENFLLSLSDEQFLNKSASK